MSQKTQQETGSLSISEPVFLVIGHLQRPHGLKGEIEMQVLTDFPQRIKKGKVVYVGDSHKEMTILGTRWKQDLMLIQFKGIEIREEVATYTNNNVYVKRMTLPPLPEGEYYHHQLIGLDVIENGQKIGQVKDILETGANDVYLIRTINKKELLLPAIESVILEIDILNNQLIVKIPEGLNDGSPQAI